MVMLASAGMEQPATARLSSKRQAMANKRLQMMEN
jgi:hypothetical protein